MQVEIRELKTHLSEYLKKVQTGEDVIVTTHGKPMARLCQLDNSDHIDDALLNLSWLSKGNGEKPQGLSSSNRIIAKSYEPLSDLLLVDRE